MKNKHFILVLFSVMMSAFLVSCDDKNAQDPFAGIEVQKGAQEFPYSTSEFFNLIKMTTDRLHPLNSSETKHWRNIWFQGYIVGCYDATAEKMIQTNAPYTTNSNVLIAEMPNETDPLKMVLVSIGIPYWQKQVGLEATEGASKNRFAKFWGDVPFDPVMVELVGFKGFGFVGDSHVFTSVGLETVFSESFSSGLGKFQEKTSSGISIWKQGTIMPGSIKCAQAKGSNYVSGVSANIPPTTDESWLVTKTAVSIPVLPYATLSFSAQPVCATIQNLVNANAVFNPSEELQLYISEESGDPAASFDLFTKVDLLNYPTGAAKVTMYADFTPYMGKTIYLAFRYRSLVWYKLSGQTQPQTWNVTNIEIK